jgi:DNA replication protein DnaC
MVEILISRCEQFVENNSVTHITTNLSPSELEKVYWNRFGSSLREMFHSIVYDIETKDMR